MKMNIEIKGRQGKKTSHEVNCSYLVKFVDPEKEYPVSYTIKQDGTKVNEPQMLLGIFLTEPQITELFVKELL